MRRRTRDIGPGWWWQEAPGFGAVLGRSSRAEVLSLLELWDFWVVLQIVKGEWVLTGEGVNPDWSVQNNLSGL